MKEKLNVLVDPELAGAEPGTQVRRRLWPAGRQWRGEVKRRRPAGWLE